MRNDTEHKELGFYLGLHYPVIIHIDPGGGFVAEIEELPGCMTQAETLEEAFKSTEDARQLWIKTAYEEGQDIPLPRDSEEYTGRFLVRIPKSLHRDLVRAAKREGVSLNQYVASLLASGVHGNILIAQIDRILSAKWHTVLPPVTSYGVKEEPRQRDEIQTIPQMELIRK